MIEFSTYQEAKEIIQSYVYNKNTRKSYPLKNNFKLNLIEMLVDIQERGDIEDICIFSHIKTFYRIYEEFDRVFTLVSSHPTRGYRGRLYTHKYFAHKNFRSPYLVILGVEENDDDTGHLGFGEIEDTGNSTIDFSDGSSIIV